MPATSTKKRRPPSRPGNGMMLMTARLIERRPISFRNVGRPNCETCPTTSKIWIGPPTCGAPGPPRDASSCPGSAAIWPTTSPLSESACSKACGSATVTGPCTSSRRIPSGPSRTGPCGVWRTRDGLPVDGADDVAGLKAGLLRRRCGHDLDDLDVSGWRGGAGRERDREDQDREHHVHAHARDEDDGLCPPRLRGERARVADALLLDGEVVLAEDAHVATERDRAHRVVDLAFTDAEEPRPEADGELEHLHAEQARGEVVTEFVHRDDERERREEEHERPQVDR